MDNHTYNNKFDAIISLPQSEKETKERKKWETPCFKKRRTHCTYVEEVKRRKQNWWVSLRKAETSLKSTTSIVWIGKSISRIHLRGPFCQCLVQRSIKLLNKFRIGYQQWMPDQFFNNDNLKSISVENDKELVSFDIVSLYTNVPVHEAIHHCADLLYNNDNETCIERNLYWTSNHEQL